MRIWDCHCHLKGDETPDQVLRAMDQAGVQRINLFSRYPGQMEGPRNYSRKLVRESIDHVAGLQAANPDRIFGLIWAEPRCEGMLEELDRGIGEKRLRGVKMIPDHWEPCDPMLFPLYAKMEELDRPIMFHSGILHGFGDSSRFCRPVLYEALINFPKLRFSLAHISWPWIDECIAVFGRFRAKTNWKLDNCQMWIDTCRGTPDLWRQEALAKAVPHCTVDRLMFGVDTTPAVLAEYAPVHIRKDTDILKNIMGLSQAQIEMFFWGSCEAFFKAKE